MRKITEIQNGQFSAKVYRDAQYDEFRVRFYHAGSLLPECDAYETDEESARGTAELGLRCMVRDEQREGDEAEHDEVYVSSETEQLNIRLACLFAWREPDTEAEQARADMIAETLRPYRVQVDAETEEYRQDILAEIGRLRRLIGCTPDGDIM